MCGIVGCVGTQKVVQDLLAGLTALQHRGQDAAGIVTYQQQFFEKKGQGLVQQVFDEHDLLHLEGNIGIGHVRYTTQGTNEPKNIQPITLHYPLGIAMAHNGNITNAPAVRQQLLEEYQIQPQSSNDLELMLYTLVTALQQHQILKLTPTQLFEAIEKTQQKLEGAYATLALIAGVGLVGFCDPSGIRPMALGKKETPEGTTYALVSESTCFDYLQYDTVDYLQAGEMILITPTGEIHRKIGRQKKQHFCVFEFIYFARAETKFYDQVVAQQRIRMGHLLAQQLKNQNLQPDVVIDVPSSGFFAAAGLATALGIPHQRGLVSNKYFGRSFILSKQAERAHTVQQKFNCIATVVAGKKVAVVDDSIVRGTTSKHIVQLLRKAGATAVYFVSAAPPIVHPCIYGIDISISTELIAKQKTRAAIEAYIEADALVYQTLPDLISLFDTLAINVCTACLSGNYPTPNAAQAVRYIEQERIESKNRS